LTNRRPSFLAATGSGRPRGDHEGAGPRPGRYSTRIDFFRGTLNQAWRVESREDCLRPLVRLADERHPLAVAQRDGITAERVLEIYACYGHEPG
jgi:hypothetical protein